MLVEINSRLYEIQTRVISYSTVAVLAGKNPNRVLTCMYIVGDRSGSLVIGEDIIVEEDMKFSIMSTSNA